MAFEISPSILPFFDAYTVFVIVLMGFIFLELSYNLGQNFDRKRAEEQKGFFGRATDIEKLLWFVVFGFIVYFIPIIGLSNTIFIVLNSNPISAIILSNLHAPLFVQFFKLNTIWNLLGTSENIFASILLQEMFLDFLFIFIAFIFFYSVIHEKPYISSSGVGNALALYLGASSFIALLLAVSNYLFYLILVPISFFISVTIYSKYKDSALKNKHINSRSGIILFIFVLILFILTVYSSKNIKNPNNDIIYFLLIGLDLFCIVSLILTVTKTAKTDKRFKEIYRVGLVLLIVVAIQISLSGWVGVMPNGHKTLHNVNVTNFSYQITGYVAPNNSSNISAIDTIAFTGYVNFSKGLNYSYLSAYNNTDFAALGSFYQANPIYDIKNGIIPPGTLVNETTAPCSFKAGISCYSYVLNNTTYIIIQRNNTNSTSNTTVMFFYNLYTNSSSIVRELHYTYRLNKSCDIQKCKLHLTFNPILNSAIVLNNFDIYLPGTYSNLTINAANASCQKSAANLDTYYYCQANSNSDEIIYPNPTTNYFEITSWIIYSNNSLNLQINMSN